MFYKTRIEKLEFEIEKLHFIISNPPKYKVGDKVDTRVCVAIKYDHDPGMWAFGQVCFRRHMLYYEFANIKTGQITTEYHK